MIQVALTNKKRKLQSFSINEKISIINEANNAVDVRSVSIKYNLPISTLKGWILSAKKGDLNEIANGDNVVHM